MTNEEIATTVAEAVTKELQPYMKAIESLQSEGEKLRSQPEDEISPGVKHWVEDQKTDRFGGKDLQVKTNDPGPTTLNGKLTGKQI